MAIDSLACNTLAENERGLGTGLMFSGASVGQAIGGAGVLFMIAYVGFQPSFVMVAAAILLVTGFVVLPMKEALAQGAAGQLAAESPPRSWADATGEMRLYAAQAFRAFLGSRAAFIAVFFALLPAGALSIALSLQSNLAVELGLSDEQVGTLSLWSIIVSGTFTVIGGWISDRMGRRLALSIFVFCASLPVLYLAWVLQSHGYVMPRTPGGAPMPELVRALWIATLSFQVFSGLIYGTFAALYMDVTNPKVAGIQFTAYMALANLAIAFAATWQGIAAEAWGYPTALLLDALAGWLCLLLLPWIKSTNDYADPASQGRARNSALVLGLACLLWLPFWANYGALGKAQAIADTVFTLIFTASAVFLLAAREVLGEAAGRWRKAAPWAALMLFAMYLRHYIGKLGTEVPVLHGGLQALFYLMPVLAAIVLFALALRDWRALDGQVDAVKP